MEKQELIQYLTQAYALESKVYEQQELIRRLELRQTVATVSFTPYNTYADEVPEPVADLCSELLYTDDYPDDIYADQIAVLQNRKGILDLTAPIAPVKQAVAPIESDRELPLTKMERIFGKHLILLCGLIAAIAVTVIPAIGSVPILYSAIAGACVMLLSVIVMLGVHMSAMSKLDKDNIAKNEKAYEQACAQHKEAVAQHRAQKEALDQEISALYQQEEKDKAQWLSDHQARLLALVTPALAEARPVLDTLENTLEQLYSLNIIFPKYRSFACVATLLEYLQSGRCDELTGPDGAYNLYESELRSDLIITKLDNIERKLDQVIANQHTLYYAISQANKRLDKITTQLDKSLALQKATVANTAIAAANTAITAACTAAIAANTEALKYIALIR